LSEQVIELTELFAAAIDSSPEGQIEIKAESLVKDHNGKVIAIDYEALKDVYVVSLVDQDDVDYEDE